MARFGHLKGVFGLLPTPYRDDFEIHTEDLAAAAEFCCASGQHGVVWPVLVGEFYLLGEAERAKHLSVILAAVGGRLPVVFGCSANSLPETMRYAKVAQREGADAVIAMAPPYATAEMAKTMFRSLADNFEGPIIVQNASDRVSLRTEELAELIDEVPSIDYIKEERPPGPHHITEVHDLLGDRVKTIFGGVGGRQLPEELSRGANGSMPACELADVLAGVMERWWAGDTEGARALHQRLLPLIIRETHPMIRHVLKERGVLTSTVQRAPQRWPGLDDGDRAELAILAQAVQGDLRGFPFGSA